MKHRTKLFVALAGSAAFASLVAGFAVASGTKAGGARVAVAKSPLGRILVDSRGITLYDFPRTGEQRAAATAPALRSGRP